MIIPLLQTELPSENLPYLFAAFAASWVIFFVYAFFITRRQREMQREIRMLNNALRRQDSSLEDS